MMGPPGAEGKVWNRVQGFFFGKESCSIHPVFSYEPSSFSALLDKNKSFRLLSPLILASTISSESVPQSPKKEKIKLFVGIEGKMAGIATITGGVSATAGICRGHKHNVVWSVRLNKLSREMKYLKVNSHQHEHR